MAFCINKFSSALCLAQGTGQCLNDLSKKCFDLTDDSDDIENVLFALSEIFKKELTSIVDKIVEDEKEQLVELDVIMKVTLPVYLGISANPTYLSFLFVCSLAHAIVSTMFDLLDCFSSAMVTTLCLRIVYEKCYKDLFNKNDDHENLDSFCKSIRPRLISEDNEILFPVDVLEQINSLLFSLNQIDHKNFTVTNDEKEMLRKVLAPVMPESEFPMTLSETHSPSTDAAEMMDCSNLDEDEVDSSRANEICRICGGKCFRFLMLHQREVMQRVNL